MSRSMVRWVVLFVIVVTAALASAQQTADATQIVRDIERNEFRFDDVSYRMTMKLIEGGETTRTIEFQVYAKGDDKLLVRITAPGELAGMAILQLGPRTMYIYNPEDRAVRLVAASARAQGLAGTDYAAADASLAGISDGWTPTLLETTAEFHKVQLVPNSGDVSPYSKLVVWYDRAQDKATKMEYYMDGELAKTMERGGFVDRDGYRDITTVRIVNARSNRVTEIAMSDYRVDTGLEDRMFTKRSLLLGE
ncbi:MAG: outer membrane lipoprotein-sorting protein [Deltaproteobacteria bacterium]|nr:outer membrane lipoprotein-sorting protein [Deltaproteobacteria bacterium]